MVGIIAPALPPSNQATMWTPNRRGSQADAGVKVDSEGRRSRFRSPPPPPGASPSLLLPTPGRYAVDATSLLPRETGEGFERQQSSATPIQPPIFTLDENRPGERQEERGGVIRLRQWFLSFAPVKTQVNVSQDSADLTHWIIIGGTRYRSEEGEEAKARGGKGKAKAGTRGSGEQWHSSLITWRETSRQLRTSSGSIYQLVGPCDVHKTCHGKKFPNEVAQKVKNGLPADWVETIVREARRRGYTRDHCSQGVQGEESGKRSPCEASDGNQARYPRTAGGKRKAIDDEYEEPAYLGKSGLSHAGRGMRKRRRGESEDLFSQDGKSTQERKKRPSGMSRELLQLQTSKLGNLTLVQVAILEGLQASKEVGDDGKRQEGKVDGLERENTPCGTPQGRPATMTPLRASSRARNATSEWWKVSKHSADHKVIAAKASTRKRSPKAVVQAAVAKSPANATSSSDVSGSEDDYHCSTSSEGEEQMHRNQPLLLPLSLQTKDVDRSSIPQERRIGKGDEVEDDCTARLDSSPEPSVSSKMTTRVAAAKPAVEEAVRETPAVNEEQQMAGHDDTSARVEPLALEEVADPQAMVETGKRAEALPLSPSPALPTETERQQGETHSPDDHLSIGEDVDRFERDKGGDDTRVSRQERLDEVDDSLRQEPVNVLAADDNDDDDGTFYFSD